MAGPVRDRLIASTVALMRRDGVAATGIAELSEHSGVARRSIYNNFPRGKDELMAAATASSGETMRSLIAEVTATTTPSEAIAAFVDFWKYTLSDSDFADGCPVMAGALAGAAAPSAPAAAAAAFQSWEMIFGAQLLRHGCEPKDVDDLASMVVSSIEGAVMAALCKRDLAPLDAVQRYLVKVAERAVAPIAT